MTYTRDELIAYKRAVRAFQQDKVRDAYEIFDAFPEVACMVARKKGKEVFDEYILKIRQQVGREESNHFYRTGLEELIKQQRLVRATESFLIELTREFKDRTGRDFIE